MPSEFLTLDGRQIELRTAILPIGKLKLDAANPRLIDELRQRGIKEATDTLLDQMIFEQEDTKLLLRSIESMGGLVEAPWVQPDGTVKEGNRRRTFTATRCDCTSRAR